MLDLPPHGAHLWIVRSWDVSPAGLAVAHAVLTAAEAERTRQLLTEDARRDHVLARALARTTLSRYAPVAPRDWVFSRTAHGRPELAAPHDATGLRFSLSSTPGLVACLVARDRVLGVDVEQLDGRVPSTALAERVFSTSEAAAVRTAPERFFDYWTLKEAYIKARGLGLAIPLHQFAFDLGHADIRIRFDDELGDQPEAWQFELVRPTPRHVMATALRRRDDEPRLTVEVRDAES